MAEEDPRDPEAAVLEAFHPFVNEDAPALRRALVASLGFARISFSGPAKPRRPVPKTGSSKWRETLVSLEENASQGTANGIHVDTLALFRGIVADGINAPEAPSTSAWLVRWMRSEEIDPEPLGTPPGGTLVTHAFASGAPVLRSVALTEIVLPDACALAKQTVGRDRADLRHVLFVLLDQPLEPLVTMAQTDQLQRLKAWLVDRIIASPEPGEDVEAWRRLVVRPAEAVRTLADAPALVDSLGRQAFAEVLGARIKEVGATLRDGGAGRDSSFILHMDGPWGSGKSSILNFLKADLERAEPRWLVVEFNAWRNQDRNPPWWPLISAVGAVVAADRKWYQFPKAWRVWTAWRWRMRWLPLLLAGFLVIALILFALRAAAGSEQGAFGIPKAIADSVGGLLALIAVGGLGLTTGRRLLFGSANAAESWLQSSSEPFRPIIRLFERLVKAAAPRPVAVFIDDLDRCDSGYVIHLLESIQTLLRSAPVVYIVAGDRKWICSSFEKRYADFCGEIGAPGRPLGYLFLDKVFQLSTSVPQLSAERQGEYWRHLLDRTDARSAQAEREERAALEAESAREMKGKTRHEDIQQEIEKAEEGSLKQEALRAAAAKQITSPEAIAAAEHRLQPFAHLLEANPRSMKRLVNAYGLNHARAFLEGRDVSVEALARWTIIELRWPLLADYVGRNWREIANGTLRVDAFPAPIRDLLVDLEVRDVIGREGESGRLTLEALKPILD